MAVGSALNTYLWGSDKHHEIPLFAESARISAYIFPLTFLLLCCWYLTVSDNCFQGHLRKGLSLSSPEIDHAHFCFEAIELPTMLYSAAGKRTGQSSGTY